MANDLTNHRTPCSAVSSPTSKPATRSEIQRMVTKASFAYPAVKLSDQEARVRLEVYADALSDIPADILGVAFLEAVKTIKFFPSIAELRALAHAEALRRKYADYTPPANDPEPEGEPITAEQRAEISRGLAALARKLSAAA